MVSSEPQFVARGCFVARSRRLCRWRISRTRTQESESSCAVAAHIGMHGRVSYLSDNQERIRFGILGQFR